MSLKEYFYLKSVKKNNTSDTTIHDQRAKCIVDFLVKLEKINNFFDIGCASYKLTNLIINTCQITDYYGCDIVNDFDNKLKKMGVIFSQADLDEGIPFSDVIFDVILCSEVIEHLFAPDNVFKFAAKNLKNDGHLIITTPNLGVWFNRIILLLGYQPAFSEVSIRYNVGKLFTNDKENVGGHLRMFTLKALVELGEAYGLKTVIKRSIGGGTGIVGKLTMLFSKFPSLGSNLFCVMKKH